MLSSLPGRRGTDICYQQHNHCPTSAICLICWRMYIIHRNRYYTQTIFIKRPARVLSWMQSNRPFLRINHIIASPNSLLLKGSPKCLTFSSSGSNMQISTYSHKPRAKHWLVWMLLCLFLYQLWQFRSKQFALVQWTLWTFSVEWAPTHCESRLHAEYDHH